MKMMLFWTAMLVLAVVPVYFMWVDAYNDRVIGRVSLSAVSLSAFSFIFQAVFADTAYDMLAQTVALVCSIALFLVWHMWRFHQRLEKKNKTVFPPNCPQDKRSGVDRRFRTQ